MILRTIKSLRSLGCRNLSTGQQATRTQPLRTQSLKAQALSFEHEYHIRSTLEKIITRYASKPYTKITLNELIKYGRLPLSDTEIVGAANHTLYNLRVLNARRLHHIRSLPYMVVLNPHILLSYTLYLKSMREILSTPPIKTPEDAYNLVAVMEDFLDKHADAIPRLSKGFTEIIGKFYPKLDAFKFLDIHLRERIIMKLTAQHFIFLVRPPTKSSSGVVDLELNINKLVKQQADLVNELCNMKYMKNCQLDLQTNTYHQTDKGEIVESGKDIVFPFIYENLEYCVLELLKNSFRAHIESNVPQDKEIQVLVNKFTREGSHVPELQIRIRDVGGGIHPDIQQQVYDFSFTTVKGEDDSDVYDNVHNRSVAGMGYGLGLSKTYCEMFGGSLHLESYWGYGTDVYIKLKGPNLALINE